MGEKKSPISPDNPLRGLLEGDEFGPAMKMAASMVAAAMPDSIPVGIKSLCARAIREVAADVTICLAGFLDRQNPARLEGRAEVSPFPMAIALAQVMQNDETLPCLASAVVGDREGDIVDLVEALGIDPGGMERGETYSVLRYGDECKTVDEILDGLDDMPASERRELEEAVRDVVREDAERKARLREEREDAPAQLARLLSELFEEDEPQADEGAGESFEERLRRMGVA